MKKLESDNITKEAWIAALLNFLVPGVGYIYAKKRVVFGIIMFLSMVIFSIYSSLLYNLYEIPAYLNMFFAAFLILSVGFAYDIYTELMSVKEKK